MIRAHIEAHDGGARTFRGFPQTSQYPAEITRIMRDAADAIGLERLDQSLDPSRKRFPRDLLCLEMVRPGFEYDLAGSFSP